MHGTLLREPSVSQRDRNEEDCPGSQELRESPDAQYIHSIQWEKLTTHLIFRMNESFPSLSRVSSKNIVESRIEINVVFFNIFEKLFRSQYLRDSYQLEK